MPTPFAFDASYITTAGYLDRADFTTGSAPGVDYPTHYSALAANQSISTYGGVDVFAITLVAGETYTFDIDNGTGGSSYIDLELDIISQSGIKVGGNDNANGGLDPFLRFTATQTGTYFVAVHHSSNDYVNGSFEFERTGYHTGDYRLVVSTPTIPKVHVLTNYSEYRSYSSGLNETVKALGGNDTILLNGGNDIALGGDGNDSLSGGSGSDELSGGAGRDQLDGGAGDDVLRGGLDHDTLRGGTERDALTGGSGHDLLYGGSGHDTVWGESGNDVLYGDGGNDILRGGSGIDRLFGGSGADTFHFLPGEAPPSDSSVEDRIEDFQIGDLIDLSDLAWGTLTWRGTGSLTGAGQVSVVRLANGYTDVRVSLDADAASEFEVLVKTSGFSLLKEDFIL